MKIYYKIAIAILSIFAVGHMAYTFYEYTALTENALWFFSASLAMLFNVILNALIWLTKSHYVVWGAIASNLLMLVFSIVLSIVIREPQAVILALVYLFVVILSMISTIEYV